MADLRAVASIPAAPGSEDVIRAALSTLADASRGHQGCVSYELYESGAVPGTFLTVETWDSQDNLDAHLRSDDVAAAFGAAEGHLGGEVVVHPLTPVS
jgi:quinol monooxygenase YgiN